MSSNALIIFVRKPEAGKVKTRLAARVGNDKALQIYNQLLSHTLKVALEVNATRHVYYESDIDSHDIWDEPGFIKRRQFGDTLGQRIENAFRELIPGYQNVIIIGSDCFELTSEIVNEAIDSLKTNDAVIGPAKDGGYYLLGMKAMIPEVFLDKSWSTDKVYNQTIKDFESLKLKYYPCPLLTDVDTVEDVPVEYL